MSGCSRARQSLVARHWARDCITPLGPARSPGRDRGTPLRRGARAVWSSTVLALQPSCGATASMVQKGRQGCMTWTCGSPPTATHHSVPPGVADGLSGLPARKGVSCDVALVPPMYAILQPLSWPLSTPPSISPVAHGHGESAASFYAVTARALFITHCPMRSSLVKVACVAFKNACAHCSANMT